MAAYAQFGYSGYPSASQMISSNATQSPQALPDTAAVGGHAATAPTLSPTGECRNNTAGGDVSSDALSPDALSQNSSTAVTRVTALTNTANVSAVPETSGAVALTHLPAATGSPCCENGRPIMTDPVSGQSVCSCQYDSARLALSSYSRLPAASVGVYGTPYPSTDQNPYQSIGVDSSAFYSPLSNPYALKDSATGSEMTAWTSASLQPTTGYYSYDPMSAYGYGATYDLAARRKNATRESTATLKAWLNEHKKNPYPTKGEKIMLAIITKMTLTQVSTWFANARRRLKKENKMTWEPKNRTDDDDDAIVSEDEKEKDDLDGMRNPTSGPQEVGNVHVQSKDVEELVEKERKPLGGQVQDLRSTGMGFANSMYHAGSRHAHGYHPYQMHPHSHTHHQHQQQHQQSMLPTNYHALTNNNSNSNNNNGNNDKIENNNNTGDSKNLLSRDCGVPVPATKPKIWSLADTVACKTPPPAAYLGQQLQQQHPASLHPMRGHLITQQQQQQQQPQQQQQQHMMSNISGTSFTRGPTIAYENFQGGPVTSQQQQPHTTSSIPFNNSNNHRANNNHIYNNSNNNNNSSSSNHSTPISIMPITGSPHPHHTHHQQQRSHHHPHPQQQQLRMPQGANQRAMGFPEAQPDTPPQTPPNMKLPNAVQPLSVVSAQAASAANLLYTATPVPMIATCRSNNFNTTNDPIPMNYGARFANDYSPRDENSIGSSSERSSISNGSANSPILNPANTENNVFKSLLISQQHISLTTFAATL